MKHEAKDADRAILMIDPFPSDPPKESEEPDDLLNVATGLLSAMRKQGMFKPEDLLLAQRTDIYNRFLIAPSRTDENDHPVKNPLASGGFEAFAGFLQNNFRQHDFMLGRRNCQRFLMAHLTLDAQNPLFDNWRDNNAMFERHRVVKNGVDHLPIIPLNETLREPIDQLLWPKLTKNCSRILRKAFKQRTIALGEQVLRQQISNRAVRSGAMLGFKWLSRTLVKRIMGKIQCDLKKRNQLNYRYRETE